MWHYIVRAKEDSIKTSSLSTSAGSSTLPRHERRSRNGRGYINRLLIFRQTPEVRDEIGKRREEPHAFFQWLSRSFRRGDKCAEFLQSPGLRVELVQPQELSLLIDFQKPPMPFVVHGKVNRAETNVCLPGKIQYSFFDIGRSRNSFHCYVAQARHPAANRAPSWDCAEQTNKPGGP